jgi:PTH1 family peptidyl-tRNA hydrolase
VQEAMAFHKITSENIIIIHDDLDLALGEMRIKKGGSEGGHNGLKDITRLIGPNYIRIRLGIDRPHFKGTEADYVLSIFKSSELKIVEEILPKAFNAILSIISHGLEKTQAEYQVKSQKKA